MEDNIFFKHFAQAYKVSIYIAWTAQIKQWVLSLFSVICSSYDWKKKKVKGKERGRDNKVNGKKKWWV